MVVFMVNILPRACYCRVLAVIVIFYANHIT